MYFKPERVYFETGVENYRLGKELLDKFISQGITPIEIEDHNKIPELMDIPRLG